MAEFRKETQRLVLRDWQGDRDWRTFFEVTNTRAVMRWLAGVLDEDGVKAQRQRVEQCALSHGHCFWLVERKADSGHLAGELLGFCGIKRADGAGSSITGEFEIGWRFREDAWGKGYAREAAQAALEAAFTQFGAKEIFALTIEENTGSWGLMLRLGMRRREELDYADPRYEPPFRDTIVYSISQSEWEAPQ